MLTVVVAVTTVKIEGKSEESESVFATTSLKSCLEFRKLLVES
jgi:hypothetical protein